MSTIFVNSFNRIKHFIAVSVKIDDVHFIPHRITYLLLHYDDRLHMYMYPSFDHSNSQLC